MALQSYLTQTAQLLQNPPAPSTLYSTADLTAYINRARLQIAGESESVRGYLTLAVSDAAQQYPFSAISLGNAPSGSAGIFSIRQASVQIGTGAAFVRARGFPWFNQYYLMDPNPQAAPPAVWSQFGQGESGSIFTNLLDGPYVLNLDCVIVPAVLVTDNDPEAIPYPWTDCVPFFAAFYAYMSAQRQPDADEMFQRYQQFASRARGMSTPGVLPGIYPKQTDPTRANKLAQTGGAGAAQQ